MNSSEKDIKWHLLQVYASVLVTLMCTSPTALCRFLLSEGETGPLFGPTFAMGVFYELRLQCWAVEVSGFQKPLCRPPLRCFGFGPSPTGL